MANVTGESAQQVSQDMTAIWNNFYDGSKTLEYYADVMAALGASTASSTSEIAQGLEKFAAIADTVGLSYEYATSALATVVAETRQSADTVGTAFKTLFARIQGLKLGETLDDGTDLNKYSQALMSVGINIKDQNGQLKEMDDILDEMGAKWKMLGKDTQVALAQTVGGARQYNQLVALMDNWDTFKDNLETASSATGTLEKQQSIYMESTAAHLEKLSAAAEDLYSSLFNSKDMNNWIDGFTKGVEVVDQLVESLGGLNNIAPMAFFGLMNSASGKISTGISQAIVNRQNNQIAMQNEQAKTDYLANYNIAESGLTGTASAEMEKQLGFYKEMYQYASIMTKEEQSRYNALVDSGAELIKQKVSLEEIKTKLETSVKNNTNIIKLPDFNQIDLNKPEQAEQVMNQLSTSIQQVNDLVTAMDLGFVEVGKTSNDFAGSVDTTLNNFIKNLGKSDIEVDNLRQRIEYLKKISTDANGTFDVEKFISRLQDLTRNYEQLNEKIFETTNNTNSLAKAQENIKQGLDLRQNIQSYIQLASSLGQVAMGISTIKNLGNIWSNDDLSTGEKLLQTMMNLGMALPMLSSASGNVSSSVKKIFNIFKIETLEQEKNINQTKNTNKLKELLLQQHEDRQRVIALKAALEKSKLRDAELAKEKHDLELHYAWMEKKNAEYALQVAEGKFGYATGQLDKKNISGRLNATNEAITKKAAHISDLESRNNGVDYSFIIAQEKEELALMKAKEEALRELLAAQEMASSSEAKYNAIKEQGIIIEESDATATLNNSLNKVKNTVAETGNAIATERDNLKKAEGAISENINTASTNANTNSKELNTVATIKNTAEKIANFAITVATNPVYLAMAIAVAAVTVATVGYTYALKQQQKEMERNLETARNYAKEQKELSDKKKEETEAISNLVNSYNALQEKYEDNEITLKDLKQQTYDLCLQYNQEELAIKSLNASYNDLIDLMKQAKIEALEAEQQSLQSSAQANQRAIELSGGDISAKNSGIWHGLNTMDWTNRSDRLDLNYETNYLDKVALSFAGTQMWNPIGGLILKDQYDKMSEYGDLNKQMADLLGADYDSFGQSLDLSSIDPVMLAEHYEDLRYALENCSEEVKNQEGWSTWNTFLNENAENVQALQSNYKDLANTAMDLTATKFLDNIDLSSLSNIEQLDTVENLRDQLLEQARNVYGESKSEQELQEIVGKWLTSYSVSDEDLQKIVNKDLIIQHFESLDKDLSEEMKNIIANLSDSDAAFITIHINAIETEEELQEILDDFGDYIEKVSKEEDYKVRVSAYLDDKDRTSSLTKQEINSLFEGTDLNEYINQSDFENLSYEQQYQSLLSYYSMKSQLISENKQELEESYAETAAAAEESARIATEAYEEYYEQVTNYYKENIEDTKNGTKITQQQFLELANSIDEINAGTATQEIMDLWNIVDEYGKTQLKHLNELNQAQEKANDKNGMAQSVLSNLVDSTRDYTKELKYLQNAIDKNNSTIDNAQQAYHLLNSTIDDYNEKGYITMDNIQSILALDSAYLDTLDIENGELSINEEMYYRLANAKMEEQKANIYNQAALEIGAYVYQKTQQNVTMFAEATIAATAAEAELQGQTYATNDALLQMIDTLKSMPDVRLTAEDLAWIDKRQEQAKKAADFIDDYGKTSAKKNFEGFWDTGKNKKSSSSSSKKKDKDEKLYVDEFDRYWDIKKYLDLIGDAMERLEKKQSKLHGQELINSLKAENKLLQQQREQYEALAAEQSVELGELKQDLGGYGFVFDENGNMQNYITQTKQLLSDYNNAVSQYNAGTMNSETFDNMSDEYEKAKTLIERYDKLFKERRDTQKDIDDTLTKEKENNLQAWTVELEVKLNTKEMDRDWNDFLGKVKENFKSIYGDFNNTFKTDVFDAKSFSSSFNDELEAVKSIQVEMRKMESGQQSDRYESLSQAQDELKKYSDQMRDDAEKVFDLYNKGWDNFNSYLDEAIDKFDELTDKYERINDDLDHQSKLIELLYGEQAYDYLNQLYDAQAHNYLGEMASLRDQAAFFKSQYEEMSELYGEDSDSARKFKEAWEKVVDDLHAKEEEYLETLADQYVNTLNKAFDKFQKDITGGSNLEWISEQWDLSKKAAEGVYDEQERIYQLQTLGNKYQEAIDKATTTKAQQKLSDLYESQVKALEDKTRLTEYDIELAEKRLAVAEAEAALEDARNNKNALKVTRGDDGNWAYQYVADDADVDDKEQNLLDAQYEAYEYVKQNVSDTKEAMMELAEDWAKVIADLEEKMIGATDEEKAQYQSMIDWYNAYYAEQMNIKADELKNHEVDLAVETNALLQTEYQVNEQNYALMTENQKAIIDGLREFSIQCAVDVYNATDEAFSFIAEKGDEVMRETIDYFATAASEVTDIWMNNPDSVINSMMEAITTCQEAMVQYQNAVNEGCIAAGENFTQVGEAIDRDKQATDDLKDATSELINEVDSAVGIYTQYLAELEELWQNVYGQLNDISDYLYNDLHQSFNDAISDAAELYDILDNIKQLQAEIANEDPGNGNKNINDQEKTFGKKGYNEAGYITSDGQTFKSYQEAVAAGYSYSDKNNQDMSYASATSKNISSSIGSGKSTDPEHSVDIDVKDLEYNLLGTKVNKLKIIFDDGSKSSLINATTKDIQDEIYSKYGTRYVKKSGSVENLQNRNIIPKFDTGGYTGDWGNSGKLAMLHEKELVLNADDTKNMLAAVSAIRDLSSVQSNIQQAVADSIAKALLTISGINGSSNTYTTSNVDSSQSNIVNIGSVEFPSAESMYEIQEAILGLPNAASQYTGRKTK